MILSILTGLITAVHNNNSFYTILMDPFCIGQCTRKCCVNFTKRRVKKLPASLVIIISSCFKKCLFAINGQHSVKFQKHNPYSMLTYWAMSFFSSAYNSFNYLHSLCLSLCFSPILNIIQRPSDFCCSLCCRASRPSKEYDWEQHVWRRAWYCGFGQRLYFISSMYTFISRTSLAQQLQYIRMHFLFLFAPNST